LSNAVAAPTVARHARVVAARLTIPDELISSRCVWMVADAGVSPKPTTSASHSVAARRLHRMRRPPTHNGLLADSPLGCQCAPIDVHRD
jgi:hypothetical protein